MVARQTRILVNDQSTNAQDGNKLRLTSRITAMAFQPGQSGNPSGGRPGSRHRQQLNGEFIAALLRDFRHGGPAAIAKVRKNQPAAYCKLLTLLCPRDFRVEHSGGVKAMTTEQIERGIELIKEMLAQREAGANAKVIEGEAEVVPSLPAPARRTKAS